MNGRLLRREQWDTLAKEANFKPAELAAVCSVSLRHLERFFHQHLCTTPRAWLRERQCFLAKQLILQGYSNKAVIAELKFASETHLCREFKKRFRVSPQSFKPGEGKLLEMSFPD